MPLAFQIRVRQLGPVQRHVRRGHQDEESVLQGPSGLHADHDQADGRRVRRSQAAGGRKVFLHAVLVEQNVSKTKHLRDGMIFNPVMFTLHNIDKRFGKIRHFSGYYRSFELLKTSRYLKVFT